METYIIESLQGQYGMPIKNSLRQLAETVVRERYSSILNRKVRNVIISTANFNHFVCEEMSKYLDSDLIENEDIIEYIALRCVGTRDGLSLAVIGRYSEWMLRKFGLDNENEIWRDELLAKMVSIIKEV